MTPSAEEIAALRLRVRETRRRVDALAADVWAMYGFEDENLSHDLHAAQDHLHRAENLITRLMVAAGTPTKGSP